MQSVTGPYEVGKQPYTIRFEYHPEATIPWALTQHIDQYRPNDPLETVLFIDGLKRILQTKKDATVRPESGNTRDMMVVSGPVTYDFVGRAIKQFYPLTETLEQAGKFNPGVDTVQPTVMTYDVLDRMLTTTLPDGTVTRTDYGFGPDRNGQVQFWTKVTDANGKTKESYADVNQSVTAVKEFNNAGQQVIWTSYEYDALNQIVKVRDDQNHETTVGYDNLGRRTQLNNPDTGLTETVYDLASNVVQRITANLRAQGKAIKHEYDYKRLIRITYPNFPGNNVSYTYGGPSEPFNRAGRIITVADQSGQEERFYGPLGEVVKSIKTIASDTGKKPEVYTTEYEYDTWNRLQKLIYPDAEVLTNQYDSGGLLQSVVGDKAGNHYKYVNRLEYDKFEQRALLEFGNGVRTNYQYAANNRRLTNLQAGKAGGKLFQDLTYQYDLVGNILGQANSAEVTSSSQMGGATQYKYQYDDLYRLVHAEGTFNEAHKSHRYQLDMGYDTVHNILSKKQLAEVGEPSGIWLENKKVSYDWQYAYSGPQPHAPTHIGERTFNYDANGNQIGWSNDENGTRRNIVWDEENRIQTILENGHAMTYKYDAAGTRVIKRGPQGETAYVNQFFVIRNGAVATKQVYAGSSRVVSKLVKQESAMDKVAKTRRGERKNDGTPGNAGGSSCDNPGQGQSPHCSSTTTPAPVTPPVTPPVDPPVTGGEGTAAPVIPTPNTPVSSGEVTPTPSTPVIPTPSSPDNGTASSTPAISSPSTGNGNVNSSSGQTSSGNNNGGQPNTSTTPNTQPTPATGKVKGPEEKDLYFYHPDHLGSTHYVTDAKGELYQHAEYFAFGESWVEQASSQRVAFGFTGKEFDEETGLYYFGARYYDARTSVWVSPDPILGAYLGGKAGMGGVFNSFNLGLYSYGHLNPVKYTDPDGRTIWIEDENGSKVQYKEGKLYQNGEEYKGNSDFVNKVKGHLDSIRNHKASFITDRFKTLETSEREHIIKFGVNQEGSAENAKKGKGSITQYDPDRPYDFTDIKSGNIVFTPLETLAHELVGHGYDRDQGNIRRNTITIPAADYSTGV